MAEIYTGVTSVPMQSQKQILDTRDGLHVKGLTIASGQGVLEEGTVLGIITASGKGGKYLDTNTNGTEVAKAILLEGCDATSKDCFVKVAIGGRFLKSKLTGYDAAAKADFAAKEIDEFDLVIIP